MVVKETWSVDRRIVRSIAQKLKSLMCSEGIFTKISEQLSQRESVSFAICLWLCNLAFGLHVALYI
jgi:hypothetical protein